MTVTNAIEANFYHHEDEAADRRSALAALKSLRADHLQQMMALPVMKRPPEARFRQLIEAVDRSPAAMQRHPRRKAASKELTVFRRRHRSARRSWPGLRRS